MLEGYVSLNSVKYLSTYIPKAKDKFIRFTRYVAGFLDAIRRAAEGGDTFLFDSSTYVEVQKELMKDSLNDVFLAREFINNFDLFSKSEQYISPRANEFYGRYRLRCLPSSSSDTLYSPEIAFLGTPQSSYWTSRSFNNLIGVIPSGLNSLDFVSYQMKEEDVFRVMVKLALGLPVNITNNTVIVMSKNIFREAIGIRSSEDTGLGAFLRSIGVNTTSAGLYFLQQAALYMGVIPAKNLKNFTRGHPTLFWHKNEEYGDVGFPIEVLDQQATKITLPPIPETSFNPNVTLGPNLKERKQVITNKILEAVDYGIRVTTSLSRNINPEKLQRMKEESKQIMFRNLQFTGNLTEEVIETKPEEEVGEFISPEELAEISAFINEGDQQEPLPDISEIDMEEVGEETQEDATPPEIVAAIREQEERLRAEGLRQTLRDSPIMSTDIPVAEPGFTPISSDELRQLDELAQQSNELLRQVTRAEELLIPVPGSRIGGAIVTGTPGVSSEPRSTREYNEVNLNHVWVNPPDTPYVAGIDPAVQQEQPVMVDTPSEAESQGETQLPI